ncbi:MAG: hypothetical protein ABJG15_04545 [Hyphomonadaceae bacterium]
MPIASIALLTCFHKANAQAAVGTCPAGETAIAEVGFAISGFENNQSFQTSPPIETEDLQLRPILAGAIQPDGTVNTQNSQLFTVETFFNSIDLHLTALADPVVPEGSDITLSLAQSPFNNGLAEILTSNDGTTFASAGTIGFGGTSGSLGNVDSTPQSDNELRHITFQVPAGSGGARFVRVEQSTGGFRVDGVQRNEICSAGPAPPPEVSAENDSTASTAGATGVLNVTANDTLGGAAISPPNAAGSTTQLQIAQGSSLPPELTFDTTSGDVGVTVGAPDGVYQFSYQICETASQINCDTATVSITVTSVTSATCPAGQTPIFISAPLPATAGFETDGSDTNPPAIGSGTANALLRLPIPAAGTGVVGFPGSNAVASFFDSIDFDLTGDDTILVPEGAIVTLAVAEFPGAPQFPITTVLTSPTANIADSTNIGTLGFGGTTGTLLTTDGANTVESDPGTPGDTALIRHVEITIPAGGARFVRIDLDGFGSPNGFQARGAQYQDACQVSPVGTAQLNAAKTVETFEPNGFSVPGADVVYTITVQNTGTVDIDNDAIAIFDPLPEEVSLVNLPFQTSTGSILSPDPVFFSQTDAALDFQFGRDVGFSSSTTAPTVFSQCTDTLAGELNPQITFICLNPKGIFAADATGATVPEITFRFRVRIR